MPGLVPGIYVFAAVEDVDGRHEPGHDARWVSSPAAHRAGKGIHIPELVNGFPSPPLTLWPGMIPGPERRDSGLSLSGLARSARTSGTKLSLWQDYAVDIKKLRSRDISA